MLFVNNKVTSYCQKANFHHHSSFLPYQWDEGSSMLTQALPSEQLFAVSMASPIFNPHLFSAVGSHYIFGLPTHHLPSSANLAILLLYICHTWPSQVCCLL